MKKIIITLTFAIAVFMNANAQAPDGFQFGAGIRAGLPIGTFRNWRRIAG
jgi:gamma-glutamyl phosphate reductase